MPKAKRAPAASTPGQTDRVFLASLAVLLVVTTLWPWLDRSPVGTVGVWMPRERRTQLLVFGALAVLVVGLTVVGLLRGPSWHFYWPWQPWPEVPSRY